MTTSTVIALVSLVVSMPARTNNSKTGNISGLWQLAQSSRYLRYQCCQKTSGARLTICQTRMRSLMGDEINFTYQVPSEVFLIEFISQPGELYDLLLPNLWKVTTYSSCDCVIYTVIFLYYARQISTFILLVENCFCYILLLTTFRYLMKKLLS